MRFSHTQTIEDDGSDTRPPLYVEVEVDLSVDYTPGDPGRFSGPPEDCYPPEGDECSFTILKVTLLDELPLDPLERKSLEALAEVWLNNDDDFAQTVLEEAIERYNDQ